LLPIDEHFHIHQVLKKLVAMIFGGGRGMEGVREVGVTWVAILYNLSKAKKQILCGIGKLCHRSSPM
jgi:hypothetical protein